MGGAGSLKTTGIQLKRTRRYLGVLAVAGATYLVLAIPEAPPDIPVITQPAGRGAFAWEQDARWDSLEALYASARHADTSLTGRSVEAGFRHIRRLIDSLKSGIYLPSDRLYSRMEESYFLLAPFVAARPAALQEYLRLFSLMRTAIKDQSTRWDINERAARETLYRLLYGGRSAVEEIILQAPDTHVPPSLLPGIDEPSVTPVADLLGVQLRSGDILVSRGGAPTSALIARGNDFPGNFSHVALVYVDSASHGLQIIESHIEGGVTVSTAVQYLQDTKLRIMVLRLRSDLAPLRHDPLLPHRAATAMLRRARTGHTPYDFSMDFGDSTSLFCSEVASSAYRSCGVVLWTGLSSISSPGLRAWLADFGVRHFVTQEPSDLEYDPQLQVVAEWRDAETLWKDHMDNAVTEAMLEEAEQGNRLHAPWHKLPLARVIKGLSSLLNAFELVGPIPEGMSATTALKHQDYSARHDAGVKEVQHLSEEFRRAQGFEPPYWEMVRMARMALEAE